MSENLWQLSACEMAEGIRGKHFTSREAVESCLGRVEQTNTVVNALTEIRSDDALKAADIADQEVAKGKPLGLLHGVPVTIKGNIDLAGWATVNGSAHLKDNIAQETSPPAQNWLNAGAVVIGRTNTPEFCVRWDTTNNIFGETKNPWDPSLTPGGSSGGAAASLAVGMTPLAHGTDLGGSLRWPAQSCGLATIRSTLGRIPDFVPSEPESSMGVQLMNTDGPMARRIADVRLGFQAMAVPDLRDPWSLSAPPIQNESSELPVAVVIDPLNQGVDDQVASGVQHANEILRAKGYRSEQAAPSTLADAVDVWHNIMGWELIADLEPAVSDICGPLMLKAFERYHSAFSDLSLEKYHLAFGERRRVLRDWLDFFQRYSVIVAPISTRPPQKSNNDIATPESTAETLHAMRMVVAINALGLPSVVVPVGIKNGLPQAVQVIGAPFQEMRCLEVAEAIESEVEALTPIDPKPC